METKKAKTTEDPLEGLEDWLKTHKLMKCGTPRVREIEKKITDKEGDDFLKDIGDSWMMKCGTFRMNRVGKECQTGKEKTDITKGK